MDFFRSENSTFRPKEFACKDAFSHPTCQSRLPSIPIPRYNSAITKVSCPNSCKATCCTEDILKKLQDMAYGCDDKGCPKEPIAEIRKLAAALIRKCPCPPAKPIEEVPAPPPSEVEEIVSPEDKPEGPTGGANKSGEDVSASRARQTPAHVVRHRLSGDEWGNGTEQVVVAKSTTTIVQPGSAPITSNPYLLIPSKVVSCNRNLGEVLVESPDNYQVKIVSSMVLVGNNKVQSDGVVTESSGRRLLVALATPAEASGRRSGSVRVGLIKSAKQHRSSANQRQLGRGRAHPLGLFVFHA